MQRLDDRRPAPASASPRENVRADGDGGRIVDLAGGDNDLVLLAEARGHLMAARGMLLAAQFALDDRGLADQRLDALTDHTARLLARWAGRTPPQKSERLPAYFVDVCIAWRTERDRRDRARGRRAA